ncbi:MAG: hypothetical protein CMH61_02510 [Nanoarchaeota archaeon]|nr:hypothetical protein [Nanoarchaeota archaeon]|tara:strand:- start:1359 stop:1874 length:516 start_codon:yes stop_codon:yes gene_type:complete
MKLEVTEKNKNVLLKRTEVTASVTYGGQTPSNAQVHEGLAKKLSADKDLVVVLQILTNRGTATGVVKAHVYDDKESKSKFSVMTKHLRKKAEEDKKTAEESAKAKEAEAEKPAEEATAEEEPAQGEQPAEEPAPAPEEQPAETPAEEAPEPAAEEKPAEEAPAEEKPEASE